jgi:hypothetical protein
VTDTVARYAATRPQLNSISRLALAEGPLPPAPQPSGKPSPGHRAGRQMVPAQTDRSPQTSCKTRPRSSDALSAGPAEGVPVSDLITVTGTSRRRVFTSYVSSPPVATPSRPYAATGASEMTIRNRECKCTPSRASALIAALLARALALSPLLAPSPTVITAPQVRDLSTAKLRWLWRTFRDAGGRRGAWCPDRRFCDHDRRAILRLSPS